MLTGHNKKTAKSVGEQKPIVLVKECQAIFVQPINRQRKVIPTEVVL